MVGGRIWAGAALVAALFVGHEYTKAQAVNVAVSAMVDAAARGAAEGRAEALQRALEAERQANQELEVKLSAAEGEARRIIAGIEAYERETNVPAGCVVNGDILDRLRAE